MLGAVVALGSIERAHVGNVGPAVSLKKRCMISPRRRIGYGIWTIGFLQAHAPAFLNRRSIFDEPVLPQFYVQAMRKQLVSVLL